MTTPNLKPITGDRSAKMRLKEMDLWLFYSALELAERTGNPGMTQTVRAMQPDQMKRAQRQVLNDFLFGEYPLATRNETW